MNLLFDTKYSYEIAADVASLEHFFDRKCEEEIKNDSLFGETLTYKLCKAFKVYELEYIQTSIRGRVFLNIHLLFELKSFDDQTVKLECVTKYCDVSKLFIVAFFVILFLGSFFIIYNYQKAIDFKVISIFTQKILGAILVYISYIFLQIKWDTYAHKEILKKLIKEFETENAN